MHVLLTLLLVIFSTLTLAESYPSKPIRFLVGAAPGGGADITARILTEPISYNLKTHIVVDNRPSVGGHQARQILQNSIADGHTIMIVSSSDMATSILNTNTPISKSKILIFATVSKQPYFMAVNLKSNFYNLDDIIITAKNKPNSVSYGSFGVGSLAHILGMMLEKQVQVKFLHVPYKGAAASVQDLLANQISFVFASSLTLSPHIQNRRLRPLAVTSITRNINFPDIPTISESGVNGFNLTGWYALGIHQNSNVNHIKSLAQTTNSILASSKISEKFSILGSDVWINQLSDIRKILIAEETKYQKLVDIKT